MTDDQIDEYAAEVSHGNSPACKNRPEHFQRGHGKSCRHLAAIIAAAMRHARDT